MPEMVARELSVGFWVRESPAGKGREFPAMDQAYGACPPNTESWAE